MPPVPVVLSLTGNGLTGHAATGLGFYKLEAGREVNGRPVWRHAAGVDRFLAFDSESRKWKVQLEEDYMKTTCNCTLRRPSLLRREAGPSRIAHHRARRLAARHREERDRTGLLNQPVAGVVHA